jgi:hypothetical protein
VEATSRIADVYDKGPGGAAIIVTETSCEFFTSADQHLRPRGRRLRRVARPVDLGARARPFSRPVTDRAHVRVAGRPVPAVRRLQPVARRPGLCRDGGLPAPDPARALHIRCGVQGRRGPCARRGRHPRA